MLFFAGQSPIGLLRFAELLTAVRMMLKDMHVHHTLAIQWDQETYA